MKPTVILQTTENLAELNKKEEEERNKRAMYRAKMTEVLSKVEMKSAKDILLVASAVSIVTNASDEISNTALDTGVALVTDMVSGLSAFSEEIDQNTLTEAGANVIGVLGNILEGSAQSMDNPLTTANRYISPSPSAASSTTAGTTSDPEAQKERSERARNTVNTLMENIHNISKTLSQNKLPGEPATSVTTPKITLQLKKDFAYMFSNETTEEGWSSFEVGSWCGGIKPKNDCDPNVVMNRQSMSSFKNPFNFDESSEYIPETAAAMTLVFRNEFNEDIPVSDTPVDIEIFCPRRGTPVPELLNYTDFNKSSYICHSIEILHNKTSLMFDFRPHQSSIYYATMLKYETKPNLTDYDHIWFFGFNESGFIDSNTDGVYSVFLPDSYIDYNTGYYYFCLAEVTPLPQDYEIPETDSEIPETDSEIPETDPSVDDNIEIYNVSNIYVQLNNVTFNYSLVLSTSGCRYWDLSQSAWSSEGCRVGPETNVSTTQCFCNHLTSFASSWFVPPAHLDFDYIFANTGFLDNITIYCTMIAIYTIFILIFIWARRKDKKDILKLGVTPLPDNSPVDRYFYEITVLTGQRKAAGTDSKVSFILSGEDNETGVRVFDDDQRKILRRGGVDRFLMSVCRPLGSLNYMRIWHDNGGKGKMQGWYLKYIVIKDLQQRKRFYFIVNRWFSVVEDDGQIERLIAVAGKDEMQEFGHVFTSHTRKNLNDGHLWFSVLSRPAGSRFTRMQRAGCCLMALWLEMLVDIMLYKVRPPAGSENPVKIGPVTITPASVMIGIESNLIVFPVSLLVINFFRKSRPRKKRKSRIMEACDRQAKAFRTNKLNRDSVGTPSEVKFSNLDGVVLREKQKEMSETSNKMKHPDDASVIITTECAPVKKKRKERFGFPWWCRIIAWILAILSTAAATVFVVFYGIQLGNEETSEWLASLFFGFFAAIFVTQPIKVILIAVFIACVMKTPGAEQEEDMDGDEEEFYLKSDEEWLHFPVEAKSGKIEYKPPNPADLKRAREQRLKEIKMFSIFREICFYSFFLLILMVVSYGNTNSMSYDVKNVLSSTFQGPSQDYKKVYLCKPHELIQDVIFHCNDKYSVGDSDTSDYGAEWTPYNVTREVPEFMYTTWEELDSYPFLGRHGLYSGGGYVIRLAEDIETVQSRIDQVHRQHWIDKHTRAVFVEFSVYNPEVNLFGVVNMFVEFLPTGSLIPYERIDVIHLLRTFTGFSMFVILSEGVFIGFLVFFIFKEVNNFRREGKAYFYKFWNWIEFLIIAISVAAVVLYFYRHYVTKEIVNKVKIQGSKKYIKLQYVANWNEVFMYMLGTVVFLATTKFLKLLRFNRRMALLSSTLGACAKDLFYFGIMFFIIFFAFVSIFYQLFVADLFDFSGIVYTMESLMGTLLGAFDFQSISSASGLLGSIFFFLYIAFMPFLLINMFITILNEAFTEVKHDIDQTANDYEMVDFIMRYFKCLIGMNKSRDLLHENNKDVDNQPTSEIDEKISDFPNKVDHLLDTIAKVYFDAEKTDDMITKMGGNDKPNLKKKQNIINFVA
ncbi:polycystic kidney disease protein 1-like 2 [Anneissia japonica]|uniref:polycystic kidney disease protein 1-like 2 n=1 Tax=Anneissia japonica TaxID=1529436 RepID=UPI0014257C58|nr:polycystic kidney disease protein 1-like 2 [Anneissia japonica]